MGQPVLVLAFGGLDLAAEPTVAIRAQVLRVVPPVRMLTFSDSHRHLLIKRGWRNGLRRQIFFQGRLVLCDGSGVHTGRFFYGVFRLLFGGW